MGVTQVFPELSPREEEALRSESRDRCRADLHYLAKEVLGYNKVTDHYHRRMAYDIDTPNFRFKLLLHPRGHYKSTLGTESRSVQKLLRNPNERILITNAKLDNSRKFLATVARHFKTNARLRWVWRDWWIDQYATAYDREAMKDKLDWVIRDVQDEFTLLRPYTGREASITTGAVDASLVSQHYCLLSGSLVFTSKGYLPVEEIRKGHRVLTKEGTFSPVVAVSRQEATGEVVRVRPAYQSEATELTANHRILVFRDDAIRWIEAGELTEDDRLVVPLMSGKSGAPSKVNDRMNRLYRTPDIWRLLGYWVGDGCRTPIGTQIRIVQGLSEQENVDDIVQIVENHLEVPVSVRKTASSTYMICFSDLDFKELTNWFGEYSYDKKLPAWVLSNYGSKQREFLVGYFRADGCRSDNTISFSSTSLDLLAGLQLLLAQHGIPSGITRGTNGGETEIVGNIADTRQDWSLSSTHPLLKLLLGERPGRYPLKPFRSFFTDRFWVVGIQELEKRKVKDQEVYDIQVAEGGSFYCPGMVVHNSTIIADDLINREYVRSLEMVEKSILYFKDLLDLLDPDGELEIIGTRWAWHDLYGWIIDEFGGSSSLRVPDNYVSEDVMQRSRETHEEEKQWMISIQPCYDEAGQPVFSEEFTPAVLQGLLEAKGPYEFGAQYLLDPTPKEHQKFRPEWLRRLDVMPKLSTLVGCITVDPATSLEDRADYSAIAVCGYDDRNRMFFLDGLEERLTEDQLLEAVFEFVRYYRPRFRLLLPLGFEAISFQQTYVHGMERKMLEEDFFFPIHIPEGSNQPGIRRRTQSKEERILRLVPRIKSEFYTPKKMDTMLGGRHRPWAIENNQPYDLAQRLRWQLTRFPHAGRDDLADALADQLEIAKATRPRQGRLPQDPEKPREFTHPSILEDRGLRPRARHRKLLSYDDAVR